MDPILKYVGAKWRVAKWILKFIPKHESYLEPFFGSGAVFFNKDPCRIETINDIDGEVVNFFRVCRTQPEELAEMLRLTPWAREDRNDAYIPGDTELEKARKFAVRCWQTFGPTPRVTNGWRNTTGKHQNSGPNNAKLWTMLPERIARASQRLMGVQIENAPAIGLIKRHNGPEVLIYADPPYIWSTRTTNGMSYKHEMTDADHEELLMALKQHKGPALLSGYENDLYNDHLQEWRKETHKTQAERGATRIECLWMNPACAARNEYLQLRLF
jgi:DNA adenine methylase